MKLFFIQGLLVVSMSMIWTSCGLFQEFERKVANLETPPRVNALILAQELDQRLMALHHYYLLGLLSLAEFEKGTQKIFLRPSYLNLLAIQIQVDEIEAEILRMQMISGSQKAMIRKIREFSSQSFMHELATQNLLFKLGEARQKSVDPSPRELEKLYAELKDQKDFFTLEKNVEHLSHLMDGTIPQGQSPFRPGLGSRGNVTGDEFPSKVWALTFEDGPTALITPKILEELQEKKLKATFFHLGTQSQQSPEISEALIKADMEIGAHSWSHQDLMRVSEKELEEELDQTESSSKLFRLPYGSGLTSVAIREKLAAGHLLHVLWNVDALDWLPQSPLRIALRTKKLMEQTKHDAGIILVHETHPRSILAASLIMDFLRQNGRRTCKIGEIVLQINQGQKTICSKEL